MASLFPDFKGLDLKVWPQIQLENYQCGVWACWASSIFLEQLRIGAPLITTPFHKYVRLNGNASILLSSLKYEETIPRYLKKPEMTWSWHISHLSNSIRPVKFQPPFQNHLGDLRPWGAHLVPMPLCLFLFIFSFLLVLVSLPYQALTFPKLFSVLFIVYLFC